ncbi:MAG: hypothetical protein KIT24_08845 [Phycisphaeraceae bacterium]|nr:hypothetical protein [Phycisphaeraceae bacterium]
MSNPPIRLAAAILATLCGWAHGTGGTSERAILLIDPTNPTSLYVGNVYKAARNFPDDRVVYMTPAPATFADFLAVQRPALLGTLAHRGLEDNTDYVIIAPGGSFFMSVPNGLVQDPCSPVRRFSVTGAYTMIFFADQVAQGGWTVQALNGYGRDAPQPRGFDGSTRWLNGRPDQAGERLFISAMLGYTGERGNTIEEILDNIDRSVLADGTFPGGTFYYMQTNDNARSSPRHNSYPAAVQAIIDRGGMAEHRMAQSLPGGSHDILGIMTGLASPNISGTNMTILPGAFCDHLTSWAATFDQSAQVKVSAWIAKGASGSWGAVEEPCNYAGKFPVANMHVLYFQGLTLGEACLRAIGFVPFQGLMYGDPLTRPWAHVPQVSIAGLPAGPITNDLLLLTPSGTTTKPGASVAGYQLFIDGARVASGLTGFPLPLNVASLSDGWHELRLLGLDSTVSETGGTHIRPIFVQRTGHLAGIHPERTQGDLSTVFGFDLSSFGSGVIETRLVQNGRVVAAAPFCDGRVEVHGRVLGAGPTRVFAEALLGDGRRVRSAPIDLVVDPVEGTPTAAPPTAYGFTTMLTTLSPMLIELPFTSPDNLDALTFTIVDPPVQGTLGGSGGWRVYSPLPSASGRDRFRFRVEGPSGASQTAEVTIVFGGYVLDRNGDGAIDMEDLYVLHQEPADINLDGSIDHLDRQWLEAILRCGEARDMQMHRR